MNDRNDIILSVSRQANTGRAHWNIPLPPAPLTLPIRHSCSELSHHRFHTQAISDFLVSYVSMNDKNIKVTHVCRHLVSPGECCKFTLKKATIISLRTYLSWLFSNEHVIANGNGFALCSVSSRFTSRPGHPLSWAGFKFLTAVVMKSCTFRDITHYGLVIASRRLGGTCRLHLHGRRKKPAWCRLTFQRPTRHYIAIAVLIPPDARRDLPQSLQGNARVVPQIRSLSRPTAFHVNIRWYIISVTNSIVKWAKKE
jgi:hypothetical protein